MTSTTKHERPVAVLEKRLNEIDWPTIESELDSYGNAVVGPLLSADQCSSFIDNYSEDERYRSRIVMSRHGFGKGEYKYFNYPLPPVVDQLRKGLYPRLADIANRWNLSMGVDIRYPADHDSFKKVCHSADQTKPTPLILKYEMGDYNCLHQDVYGAHVFPLQVAFLLSKPGEEFTGGEFTLTEQRPRMQSRVEVVSLEQGMGVIFPVNHRPVQGTRGTYRVNMRHGVSRVRSGRRFTMGVIFHDGQ